MTGLKPYLGFIASLVVFAVIVAYVAAIQWNPVLRAKSLQVAWVMLWPGAWMLGLLIGALAWTGGKLAYILYVMTEMWSTRVGTFPRGWWQSLDRYCRRRAFYRPGHAA